ncbi:MAG: DUF3299 domain-containing protein [bacterium]
MKIKSLKSGQAQNFFTATLICACFTLGQSLGGAQLSDIELNLEPPTEALSNFKPVPVSEVQELVLEGILEFGYQDELGRYVVDLLEKDKAYLGVRVSTPEGRPVFGAMPSISVEGSSRLLLSELTSAEDGVMNFGVIGGSMGVDTVTASIGDVSVEFVINVISLRAAGFPILETIEGGLAWDELMQAQLEYKGMSLVASFPDSIKARAGETVKLSGFMMPLDPTFKQKHFLLTSNPPSCFFHVPGGPAGSVEVLATEGIEVSWDPVVIEGRFEPQETSEIGVVYRIVDARLIKP